MRQSKSENERYRGIRDAYKAAHGVVEYTHHDVAVWATEQGLVSGTLDQLLAWQTAKFSEADRSEMTKDRHGRAVRANCTVTIEERDPDTGEVVQKTNWTNVAGARPDTVLQSAIQSWRDTRHRCLATRYNTEYKAEKQPRGVW